MDRIKELKQQRANKVDELQAIVDLAKSENRGFTDEERQQLADGKQAIETLDVEIAKLEEDAQLADYVGGQPRPAPLPRQSSPARLGSPEDAFLRDPNRGFRTPREFLSAVMTATTTGRVEDPRIRSLAAGADEHATVFDPHGGFLIPDGFLPNLLTVGNETDPTAGRTTRIPMSVSTVKIPARTDKDHSSSVSGGLRVYRRNETDTATSSRMTVEQVVLEANSLMGISYASEELLAESPMSFMALIERGFADEFRAKIIYEKLHGTGSGEYEGVLNSPALVSVAKETGQIASTIVYENVIKMYARCWGKGEAIWLANHDTLPQLMQLHQTVGTAGTPVWQPSAREGEPSTLMGRPIFFTEFCESVGTVGDILLVNWREYLEGFMGSQTPESAESVHVRFVNNERTFRFLLKNDGRGWWRSALTPRNGDTLSPFVALATRS